MKKNIILGKQLSVKNPRINELILFFGLSKTKSSIIKLESFGYKCFARSNSFLEYSFIKLEQN